MTKILVLESSLLPDEVSASRRVTAELLRRWSERDPGIAIVHRDLARDPLPHADLALMSGTATSATERSPDQAEAAGRAEKLIEELLAVDVVVIAAPMYNFGIPSTLKAWIDHVAIAGKTFRYNAEGRPEGLVHSKHVVIIASRGGVYSSGPMMSRNFQDTYLKVTLGLLGMTDVTVIEAERQKMGSEHSVQGIAGAHSQIDVFLEGRGGGTAPGDET